MSPEEPEEYMSAGTKARRPSEISLRDVILDNIRHQVAAEIFEELERADLIRTEDCGAELWVHEYPLLKAKWLK